MESESEASVHSTSDDTDTVRQSASSIRIDDGWDNRYAICHEKAKRFCKANPAVAKKDNPHKETKTVFRCKLCDTCLCIRAGSPG